MPDIILLSPSGFTRMSAHNIERHQHDYDLVLANTVDLMLEGVNILSGFEVHPAHLKLVQRKVDIALVVGSRPFEPAHCFPVQLCEQCVLCGVCMQWVVCAVFGDT